MQSIEPNPIELKNELQKIKDIYGAIVLLREIFRCKNYSSINNIIYKNDIYDDIIIKICEYIPIRNRYDILFRCYYDALLPSEYIISVGDYYEIISPLQLCDIYRETLHIRKYILNNIIVNKKIHEYFRNNNNSTLIPDILDIILLYLG